MKCIASLSLHSFILLSLSINQQPLLSTPFEKYSRHEQEHLLPKNENNYLFLINLLFNKNESIAISFIKAFGNQKDIKGKTLLHHAAINHNEPILIFLLKQGVNVNATDLHKRTALHYAAIENKIVKITNENNTSRTDALTNTHLTIIQQLIKYGAQINLQDKYGKTPLYYGVINPQKSTPLIHTLITHNANLDLYYFPEGDIFNIAAMHSSSICEQLITARYNQLMRLFGQQEIPPVTTYSQDS